MLTRRCVVFVVALYTVVFLFQVRCTHPAPPAPRTLVVAPVKEEAFVGAGVPAGPAPVEKLIPMKPEPWQKKPPCDADQDERQINGACWQATSKRPPCGTLYRYEDLCVRPMAEAKPKPVSGQE